ncbi:MAG: hypothetical protein QXL88_01230 [Candidatus Pacearchaeota archaeon]
MEVYIKYEVDKITITEVYGNKRNKKIILKNYTIKDLKEELNKYDGRNYKIYFILPRDELEKLCGKQISLEEFLNILFAKDDKEKM